MLTVHTCPTSDLEELCKRFEFPKTFEESVMLRGAKAELRHRRSRHRRDIETDLENAARKQMPVPGKY